MAYARRNWMPIKKLTAGAAKEQGYTMGFFEISKKTPDIQMAICETCGGICWVSFSLTRGFAGGGRAAKYKCGTPEAMGMLRQEQING